MHGQRLKHRAGSLETLIYRPATCLGWSVVNLVAPQRAPAETDKMPRVCSKSRSPQYPRLRHREHQGPGEETMSYHLCSSSDCL